MSTAGKSKTATIRLLDKEYLVACPEEEQDDLLASARFLDKKMREIRDSGKVVGIDRIAVMAALNIAHELLGQTHNGTPDETVSLRIKSIQNKIDEVLNEHRQLEF